MNTKTIAIVAVVVVIVIVAAAAVIVMGDDDDDDKKQTINTGWGDSTVTTILGNVNGDDTLDSSDIAGIQQLIDDGASASDYPWADANQDGKIDSADIEVVQKLINGESTPVNVLCLDRNGEQTVVQVTYPLRDIVTYTGNINADVLLCGGQQYVAGYNNCAYKNLEADLIAVDGITDLAGSSMSFAFNKFIQLDGDVQAKNGTGVGALVGDASRRVNLNDYYDQFETAGIPVILLNTITMSDQISAVMTLGYLFGPECYKQAQTFRDVCQPIAEEITSKIASLADSEKDNVVGIIMGYYLMASTSEYYTSIKEAGGIPYYTENSAFASAIAGGHSVALSTTENILVNYDNQIDHIMSARSVDSKSSNLGKTITDLWEKNQTYFESLDCYHSFFYVNALLPAVIKVAYIAENLYPDLMGTGYGDSVFAKVAAASPYYLSGCTVTNTFTDVTYSDYEGIKNGTIHYDEPDTPDPTPVTPDEPVQTDASAKAIADVFVEKNPKTAYTNDAKTIAEGVVANMTYETWSVVDGATEDKASVQEAYTTSSGTANSKTHPITRSATAAADYAALVEALNSNDSYKSYVLVDTSSIEDVNVTAKIRVTSQAALFRFAMQCGSIVVDCSTDYVYVPSTSQDDALAIVKGFADAIKNGAHFATWEVADGATDASATLNETYTTNSGSNYTRAFPITTGVSESKYESTVSALAETTGSYAKLTPTFDNENIKCTAFGRTMGSSTLSYLLKFVMYYNGAMIEVTDNSIYINNNVQLEAYTLLNDFAAAIVAGGGNPGSSTDQPTTASTDAKSAAEYIVANATVGEWSVGDGATEDSATVVFHYTTTKGVADTRTFNILRTEDAATQYATMASNIKGLDNYYELDTSSIDKVNVTAATRHIPVGSLVLRFAMQYGDLYAENNGGLINLGKEGTTDQALSVLQTIAAALTAGSTTSA